eukprot:Lankesteria_metandrocarpae@DN2298_c0_g1_i1.p1
MSGCVVDVSSNKSTKANVYARRCVEYMREGKTVELSGDVESATKMLSVAEIVKRTESLAEEECSIIGLEAIGSERRSQLGIQMKLKISKEIKSQTQND